MAAGDKARRTVEQWALQHEMIPEQLDPLAELIRETYVRYRRSAFPFYNLNTTKYNIVFWRLVATKVKDLNADVVTYVATAFKQFGAKTYPEGLLSVHLAQVYDSPAINAEEQHTVELLIRLYADKLQTYYASGRRSLSDLLLDDNICPCPLFKWCIAIKNGLYDIAAKYRLGADRVLMDPAYRSVYTRVFKEVFDGSNR